MELSERMRDYVIKRVRHLKSDGMTPLDIEVRLSPLVDSQRELKEIIRQVFEQ